MSEYSVEQIDEDAMTEFIQARTCRRQVLSRHFDQGIDRTDCHSTDSVFCDRCKTSNRLKEAGISARFHGAVGRKEGAQEEEGMQADTEEGKGVEVIARRLGALQESYESMIAVMDRLQGGCIYCQLIIKGGETGQGIPPESGSQAQLHTYNNCPEAEADKCGFAAYQQWREGIDLKAFQHCWKCGLSQDICRGLEDNKPCEYPKIVLPGMFILHRRQHLGPIVETVGFQGDYNQDVWEWFNEIAEGFGSRWESNWMKTWEMVCQMYTSMTQ